MISDGHLKQIVAAYNANGRDAHSTAEALICKTETLGRYLRLASERGMLLDHPPAMPGFRISQVTEIEREDKDGNISTSKSIQQKPEHGEKFAVADGQRIKRVSALTDSEDRVIVKWNITEKEPFDPRQIAEWLKDAFADYAGAAEAKPSPLLTSASLLTLIPCNDWHVGMYAWGRETGENWDLKIAEDTIGAAVVDVVSRSPAGGTCIILGGGDLLHADNSENRTARSGNVLQVDGRYQKVVRVAARLKVKAIDAALERYEHVTVRILPGNHDEHTAVAIAYFLLAWYRNEPRVTVDVDPSLFFWFRFGKVMLGATHGHTVKIEKMPGIMAHRRAEDWGATRFRYVHGFHLHHSAKIATEGDGVLCEIHQAPIPQDAWHFGAGFLSGRSLQAITYHRDFGEVGRVRAAILDASK